MSKYYKAEDVLAIFSDEERPLNWTDSEAEIQAENDFDYYKALLESLSTIEVDEDAISRKYVRLIESDEDAYYGDWNETYERGFSDAIDKVLNAPSVVPSREEGEWEIAHEKYEYIRACSECGWLHDLVHYGDSFCPHCGAKMKGAENE